MKQWLESVYSDGSECFVSNPRPSLGETVRIAVRMYADAPVKHVVLRYMPNGAEHCWFNRDCTFFDPSVGGYRNPQKPERGFYFYAEGSNDYYAWAGYDSLPTLDYTCEELRNRIYRAQDSVLRKWLKTPYSIDGWRFDVADVFARKDDVQARVMQYLAKVPFALWQNQFNLIDSHDFPRVHSYTEVHPEEYKGAVILQFMLIGTPSVYYGDEVAIDGGTAGDEGYRHPMPWSEIPGRNPETYEFYRKLMHLKQERKALCEGGMKFLYAQGNVLALARFCQDEVLIAVMSTDDEKKRIRLPLAAAGVDNRTNLRELFGKELKYEPTDEKSIWFEVEPHRGYLMECEV